MNWLQGKGGGRSKKMHKPCLQMRIFAVERGSYLVNGGAGRAGHLWRAG